MLRRLCTDPGGGAGQLLTFVAEVPFLVRARWQTKGLANIAPLSDAVPACYFLL